MTKTEGFYQPEGGAVAQTARRKPGPKAKLRTLAVDPRATAAGQGYAADAATQPGPTIEIRMTDRSHLEALAVDSDSSHLTADAGISTAQEERGNLKADIERIRSLRKPFGAFTQKLAYAARPGYHRHWFSDEPGRVDEAMSNGWAHVKDKEGKPVNRTVGRARDGGALKGFLMELPKVFWDEDMQARHDAAQARVDEIKKQPFRSKPGQATRADEGKFYSPKDEVVSLREDRASGRAYDGSSG